MLAIKLKQNVIHEANFVARCDFVSMFLLNHVLPMVLFDALSILCTGSMMNGQYDFGFSGFLSSKTNAVLNQVKSFARKTLRSSRFQIEPPINMSVLCFFGALEDWFVLESSSASDSLPRQFLQFVLLTGFAT